MKLYSLTALSAGRFQKATEIPPGKFPQETFVIVDDVYIKYDTQEDFEPQQTIICDGKKYKYAFGNIEDKSLTGSGLKKTKSYIWIIDTESTQEFPK